MLITRHSGSRPDILGDEWTSATLRALVVAVMASFCATAGQAQEPGKPDQPLDLAWVNEVTIGASQLTPDGARCGLDFDHLVAALSDPLRDTGLDLRADAKTRVVLSAVSGQLAGGQCATSVMLGVYAKETFFSADIGWLRNGNVVLWQRSLLVATPIAEHRASVEEGARRLATQLLADRRDQSVRAAKGIAGAKAKADAAP